MPLQRKKIWIIIFKLIVLVGAYGFIAYRIGFDTTLRTQIINGDLNTNSIFWLLLALLMMPVNWLLEALKWQILLKPVEQISLSRSFVGVLAGISVAIFTPNRTGEYFGRIWILRQKNRAAGVSITIAGSLAQSTITFLVGLLVGWYWLVKVATPSLTTHGQMIMATFVTVIVVVSYFLLPYLSSLVLRFRWRKIIHEALNGLQELRLYQQSIVLAVSAIRYVIFTIQFIILLYFFDCQMSLVESLVAIGMLYAAMLIIPSITIAEPGIRGGLSLLIFSVFCENEAGILAASLTLWIINLAIPALTGAVYLAALKIDKPW